MAVPTTAPDPSDVESLVNRLFESLVGALELFTIHIGDQLGLYDLLADEPMTAPQLAERSGCDTRYVREWLEQQAATGLIGVDDATATPDNRLYRLSPAAVEVLTNRDSLSYLGWTGQDLVGTVTPIDRVVDAFRTGDGVPFGAYGEHTRESVEAGNRPAFINQLASEWIPAMPDIHQRLQTDPPARVADIGCGSGWSSIALAQAFPRSVSTVSIWTSLRSQPLGETPRRPASLIA